ncbi:MAG TPA: N-acetylneuraminate synthase [Ramlibacter sp.]|uniref:N-acetylneuraminate synthase n=1 Tax=Ramlibacter sp. TaxID=1917967 RepID=UPI002CAFEC74|nr:N-acetylneuraminate synthase [Ramlibacter sp.]HVZ45350.1 N-acetylneuraminate synthase [Ramlibacter sp.]
MTPWQQRVFVIGEAGVNHNGDLALALGLVDVAADAGCDAVKFQTFRAEALVTRDAAMADYQRENTGVSESQFDMLKRLELDEAAHRALAARAGERGIAMFSTAFDLQSVDLLAEMGIPLWKIPSGEITNYPYLVKIAQLGQPIVLSTGMATLADVAEALDVLLAHGAARERVCVLHCNTDYPTRFEDVNLRAMATMGRALGVAFGYSDHTPGVEIPTAAVALGARVIEKHFTLDRALPGPDQAASLEPGELGAMVRAIRRVEAALGDGIKRPSASEAKNRAVARKSIVAARAIAAGEPFTEANVTVKRPGTGISPMRWNEVLGVRAPRAFAPDEPIELPR